MRLSGRSGKPGNQCNCRKNHPNHQTAPGTGHGARVAPRRFTAICAAMTSPKAVNNTVACTTADAGMPHASIRVRREQGSGTPVSAKCQRQTGRALRHAHLQYWSACVHPRSGAPTVWPKTQPPGPPTLLASQIGPADRTVGRCLGLGLYQPRRQIVGPDRYRSRPKANHNVARHGLFPHQPFQILFVADRARMAMPVPDKPRHQIVP
jgi:hypothetical protein